MLFTKGGGGWRWTVSQTWNPSSFQESLRLISSLPYHTRCLPLGWVASPLFVLLTSADFVFAEGFPSLQWVHSESLFYLGCHCCVGGYPCRLPSQARCQAGFSCPSWGLWIEWWGRPSAPSSSGHPPKFTLHESLFRIKLWALGKWHSSYPLASSPCCWDGKMMMVSLDIYCSCVLTPLSFYFSVVGHW